MQQKLHAAKAGHWLLSLIGDTAFSILAWMNAPDRWRDAWVAQKRVERTSVNWS
jgi:hypothetical protein